MPKLDWLITNGRIMDPATGLDQIADLGIQNGKIAQLGPSLDRQSARHSYDATNQLVVPGLVDLHIHGYQHATPLGIDVDHYCLGRGVTTAVDAGSAGCDTFPGFRAFAAAKCRTRLLAFLHISRAGLAFSSRTGGDDPGELETLKLVNQQDCIDCVEDNRDLIIGIKIRLSSSIADDGKTEAESYRRSLVAAETVGLPLMTHHNFSTVPLKDCPGRMRSGDIYTHCFHAYPSTILNPTSGTIEQSVMAAQQRGVLFDIGHGMGSFSWPVADCCASNGFWPDTISTDIHSLNMTGPVYDLPTVMTRLLHVGMPLMDVIRATTQAPAKAIHWDDRIGSLQPGREADVTVMSLTESSLQLEDCHAQLRSINQQLTALAVWRAGEPGKITQPDRLPNSQTYQTAIDWRDKLVIRDET